MFAIELPDGSLYRGRRWKTAEAAGRFLATASDIKSGNVVSVTDCKRT